MLLRLWRWRTFLCFPLLTSLRIVWVGCGVLVLSYPGRGHIHLHTRGVKYAVARTTPAVFLPLPYCYGALNKRAHNGGLKRSINLLVFDLNRSVYVKCRTERGKYLLGSLEKHKMNVIRKNKIDTKRLLRIYFKICLVQSCSRMLRFDWCFNRSLG